MLRLRKVKMPDGTISYSCKITLEDACPEVDAEGESGLEWMLSALIAKVSTGLHRLSKNIDDCDEVRIDATGTLHAKTGVVVDDAEDV